MPKLVAIYVRVSSRSQDTRSQEEELKRWVAAQPAGIPTRWYRDSFTGTTMARPAMTELLDDIAAGKVGTVAVWRLDRLGRTAKGLTSLFEDLRAAKVNLVSLKDGLDLGTPAGRLMANVLASVAAYETEVRKERQAAGIAAARAKGKRWGGRKKGARTKVTAEQIKAARRMKAEGEPIARIARLLGLSRPTVYGMLAP
jgi:DNA invertase Pin-like site-specific DNA recombinase